MMKIKHTKFVCGELLTSIDTLCTDEVTMVLLRYMKPVCGLPDPHGMPAV